MSPYITIRAFCPLCHQEIYHKTVLSNTPTPCGDPRITCPHCGRETTDDNVLELALRPKSWYDTHYMKKTVYIPLIFLPFLGLLVFGLIGMQFEAVRRLPAIVLGLLVFVIFILGLIPGIRYMRHRCDVKPGTAQFESDYRKSEERLRDPQYKQFLFDSGYVKRHGMDEVL